MRAKDVKTSLVPSLDTSTCQKDTARRKEESAASFSSNNSLTKRKSPTTDSTPAEMESITEAFCSGESSSKSKPYNLAKTAMAIINIKTQGIFLFLNIT